MFWNNFVTEYKECNSAKIPRGLLAHTCPQLADRQCLALYDDIPTVNFALVDFEDHLLAEQQNNSSLRLIKTLSS